jgi:hypothetical protein
MRSTLRTEMPTVAAVLDRSLVRDVDVRLRKFLERPPFGTQLVKSDAAKRSEVCSATYSSKSLGPRRSRAALIGCECGADRATQLRRMCGIGNPRLRTQRRQPMFPPRKKRMVCSAAVFDWVSRCVVRGSISAQLSSEFVTAATLISISRLGTIRASLHLLGQDVTHTFDRYQPLEERNLTCKATDGYTRNFERRVLPEHSFGSAQAFARVADWRQPP